MYEGPIFDACAHHHWASQEELMDYMPANSARLLGRRGDFVGQRGLMPLLPMKGYYNPLGDKLAGAMPSAGGPAGSDFDTLVEHVLHGARDARVVLAYDAGALAPALNHPYLALDACRAANDWSIERWISRDDRLHGLVLAPSHIPELAAAEIRRAGQNPRMVGVLLCANGLGKPFGHPAYHPIYAAADEMGLPVVLQAGGDDTVDVLTHTSASGEPLTHAEYHILLHQPLMTHTVSLMGQGVFTKHPGLKVLLAGAGAIWIHHLIARFDLEYKALRLHNPWMKRLPSEYLRDNIRLTTQPLDRAPSMDALVAVLSAAGEPQEYLCFASGYPNWDATTAAEVSEAIPSEWWSGVFYENAQKLFRWTSRGAEGGAR
jgi:predicted TIM-barrel fold metal-dependent hydrolase